MSSLISIERKGNEIRGLIDGCLSYSVIIAEDGHLHVGIRSNPVGLIGRDESIAECMSGVIRAAKESTYIAPVMPVEMKKAN